MRTRFIYFALLFAVFCGSAGAATEAWVEVRSPHFTVLTDSNEKQARRIADQLERMRWMFQTMFPKVNVDPVSPIVVLAVKNEKGFQLLEPESFLTKGQMLPGGIFMRVPDKNYILLRLDADFEHPFAGIYHEYTHLQFSGYSSWMPLWLNEGWAEFFQNTEIRDKEALIGQPSVDNILYLRQKQLIPLDVLFQVDQKSPYYHEEKKGSVFYAESWALTHYIYLTDHQKGLHRLDDYMTRLLRHEDNLVAAEKAFGDLKQLLIELEIYIQRGEYKYFVSSSAAAPIDESSYKVRPLKQFEWDAASADFLAYIQRIADARTRLDAVFKTDPNNAQAHETMGYLEFRLGHVDAARKWYAEAVRLGSQNYLAHYYFAWMTLMLRNSPQDKEIEGSLSDAIRLNPRYFAAYDLLATVLMSQDRMKDAQTVLLETQKIARTPNEAEATQRRIDEIEKIQAERARFTTEANATMGVRNAEINDVVELVPLHPSEPPNGPKHVADGVIRGVQCSEPAAIEFQVVGVTKTVTVYSNNYHKLDFTALGFTPESNLNPCTGIQGMNAQVRYAESTDKTVDGQVIAVELRK